MNGGPVNVGPINVGPVNVGVLGAAGRMGFGACAAIEASDDLSLVARVGSSDSLDVLVASGAQVAVDLTRPDAVLDNVAFCIEHGISVVVGTSGVDDGKLDRVRELLAARAGAGTGGGGGAGAGAGGGARTDVGVLVVPNFALGAVLMMRFAQIAAPYFESVEIVELHHPDKVDAPSGTALRTAALVAAARRTAMSNSMPDATTTAMAGARGAEVDGVRVHSVRARGLLAHQEVLLGNAGETLTIRHDSVDRAAFMPGLLLAVRGVSARPGLTVGLETLL